MTRSYCLEAKRELSFTFLLVPCVTCSNIPAAFSGQKFFVFAPLCRDITQKETHERNDTGKCVLCFTHDVSVFRRFSLDGQMKTHYCRRSLYLKPLQSVPRISLQHHNWRNLASLYTLFHMLDRVFSRDVNYFKSFMLSTSGFRLRCMSLIEMEG